MSQDILITPKSGEPQILFRGSGTTDTPIVLNVLSSYQSATGSGTAVVFEGTEGQLFGVSDNLSSGTIFSVSDITGLPSIEFLANGELKLGEFGSGVNIYNTNFGMTLAAHGGAATHIPAFVQDPASGVTRLGFRTAAQIRSDIGAGTGNGSVTSVATNNGLTGGTITTTGTLGLTGQALALHNLASNGVIARTGAGTVAARTITGTTNQVTVTNGDGVAGNPTLSLPQNIHTSATPTFGATTINGDLGIRAAATATTSTQIPVFIADPSATTRTIVTRTPAQLRTDINAPALNGGNLFTGTGSFRAFSIRTSDAGGLNWSWFAMGGTSDSAGNVWHIATKGTPDDIGFSGALHIRGNNGSQTSIVVNQDHSVRFRSSNIFVGATTNTGGTPIGTVTSIATNNGITGGTITTTGTVGLTGQALALHNLSTNGLIARTGTGTVAGRTITGTTNQVTVTNGDGVAGNPTLSLPQNIHTGAIPTFSGATINGTLSIRCTQSILPATFFPSFVSNPSATTDIIAKTAEQVRQDIGAQAALTNPVTGTGTNGQISIWNGTTSQNGTSDFTFLSGVFSSRANSLFTIDGGGSFRIFDEEGERDIFIADNDDNRVLIYPNPIPGNNNGLSIGSSEGGNSSLSVVSSGSTSVSIVARFFGTQVQNIQEWTNHTNQVLASVNHSGNFSLRTPATGVAATQIPVFTADPSSTTRLLVTRTPAQLRSDIGAGTGNGTVTSIATNNGITGGTITGTGTVGLDGQALALHNLATNGLIARTGTGTVAGRTITGTANRVTVTNGDGVAGNPTLTLPQDIHTSATPTFGGGTLNGQLNLRASATGVAATQIPVFTADPASTTRLLVTRTPAQLLSDIGAQATLTNPVTGTGANGQVSFWTSSSAQSGDNGLLWDNTNKRLGIGTTAPSRLLEVVGGSDTSETSLLQVRSNFTGNNTASTIRFANSTDASAGNGAVELAAIRTNAAAAGDSDFVIRTAAGATLNERVRVTSNGRVGINTDVPAQALHIQGNGARIRMSTSSNPGVYRFDIESNYNAGNTINFYGANDFNFLKWIYNTSALCLNPDGGVLGVGTTSPDSRFHLNTVTAASTGVIIRGSASQSADLQQWQDNTAAALASVNSVGNFSLRAPATGVAATQIPVFTADPSSTTRLLVTRTPSQLLSDIGAASSSHTHAISGVTGLQTELDGKLNFVNLTVSTAAATAAKTTVETVTFVDGFVYYIKFTLGNSVSNPTVNGVNIRLGTTNASTTTFTVGANAVVPMVYDAASDKLQLTGSYRTSDSVESYTIRWIDSSVIAGETVTRYKLMMMGDDGRFYPLVTGDSTGANAKTVNTRGFVVNSPVLVNLSTTTFNENAAITATNLYQAVSMGTNFAYNQNQISGWTDHRPLYLVGTINSSGLFVLRDSGTTGTNYLTQTLPTTEDGFVYIYIGMMYTTTTSFRLISDKMIVEYREGALRPYTFNSVLSVPVTSASGILNSMVMSEATYNALGTKNANTLYFLT